VVGLRWSTTWHALALASTVRDGAILDLAGHTISCGPLFENCVVLTGKGAKLLNGIVKGDLHTSLLLSGAGRHTVRNLTSLGPVDGNVIVMSDHNTLINVTAESSVSPAFAINGDHNRLTDSIALCTGINQCVVVGGDDNQLIDNFVKSDSRVIFVGGDNNVLQGNRAILTGSTVESGISVVGAGNRVTGNTAIGENGIDLRDLNGDCTHNTWRHNIFVTGDPACIR
jgi:hypothetical protein